MAQLKSQELLFSIASGLRHHVPRPGGKWGEHQGMEEKGDVEKNCLEGNVGALLVTGNRHSNPKQWAAAGTRARGGADAAAGICDMRPP